MPNEETFCNVGKGGGSSFSINLSCRFLWFHLSSLASKKDLEHRPVGTASAGGPLFSPTSFLQPIRDHKQWNNVYFFVHHTFALRSQNSEVQLLFLTSLFSCFLSPFLKTASGLEAFQDILFLCAFPRPASTSFLRIDCFALLAPWWSVLGHMPLERHQHGDLPMPAIDPGP